MKTLILSLLIGLLSLSAVGQLSITHYITNRVISVPGYPFTKPGTNGIIRINFTFPTNVTAAYQLQLKSLTMTNWTTTQPLFVYGKDKHLFPKERFEQFVGIIIDNFTNQTKQICFVRVLDVSKPSMLLFRIKEVWRIDE